MKMQISDRHSSVLKSHMESTENFVAEWFSLAARCFRVDVCLARKLQHKDILINFDEQVWKDSAESWQKDPSEKRRKVLPRDDAIVSREVPALNAECHRLGISGKLERSHATAGWDRVAKKWKKATVSSEALHNVREG